MCLFYCVNVYFCNLIYTSAHEMKIALCLSKNAHCFGPILIALFFCQFNEHVYVCASVFENESCSNYDAQMDKLKLQSP